LAAWIAKRPGAGSAFRAADFTRTALTTYLDELADQGLSLSSRTRAKVIAGRFARWLIEDQGLLRRNPARDVTLPPQPQLAPRELSGEQRFVLRTLVEREGSQRGAALFALGYWAGCRVSDVSHLKVEDAHIGPKTGWLRVGYKGGKFREIDLVNDARRPLHDWLEAGERRQGSPYVFTSQRAERLTENGIHRWFATLKARARKDEWELIGDVTFHDLRHDFAHRARAVGWSLEEVAYYLGHITARGTPAIATTVRYTQVSREQVKARLGLLRG
jgi:site-specific recombinase XerD